MLRPRLSRADAMGLHLQANPTSHDNRKPHSPAKPRKPSLSPRRRRGFRFSALICHKFRRYPRKPPSCAKILRSWPFFRVWYILPSSSPCKHLPSQSESGRIFQKQLEKKQNQAKLFDLEGLLPSVKGTKLEKTATIDAEIRNEGTDHRGEGAREQRSKGAKEQGRNEQRGKEAERSRARSGTGQSHDTRIDAPPKLHAIKRRLKPVNQKSISLNGEDQGRSGKAGTGSAVSDIQTSWADKKEVQNSGHFSFGQQKATRHLKRKH